LQSFESEAPDARTRDAEAARRSLESLLFSGDTIITDVAAFLAALA
jgi:hypothetical protein